LRYDHNAHFLVTTHMQHPVVPLMWHCIDTRTGSTCSNQETLLNSVQILNSPTSVGAFVHTQRCCVKCYLLSQIIHNGYISAINQYFLYSSCLHWRFTPIRMT